jgi:hypothetical protein
MKSFFLTIISFCFLSLIACKDDEPTSVYEYHVHIHEPSTAVKQLDDTLDIEVEFESHTGEPVHHINVRIYNKSTLVEVYNLPAEPHVHDVTGAHAYTDEFVLSAANGLAEGDWILEGKVWGHEDGVEETTEKVEFHINP